MITKIFKDLAKFEGLKLKPYRCTAGKLTIGYGRNLDDTGISRTEAEIFMFFDICRIMDELDRKLNFWVHQPVAVKAVLIQMAYQLGVDGLLSFNRFLRALSNSDYTVAVQEMFDSRWALQTPRRVATLAEMIQNRPPVDNIKLWKDEIKDMNEIRANLISFSLFE
jgi:lysozyme